jgi:hypothetical protein
VIVALCPRALEVIRNVSCKRIRDDNALHPIDKRFQGAHNTLGNVAAQTQVGLTAMELILDG